MTVGAYPGDSSVFRTLPREYAAALKRMIDHPASGTAGGYIGEESVEYGSLFGPIVRGRAENARARCRFCGVRIETGQDEIQFQIDFYKIRFGRWGHATKAFAHARCVDEADGGHEKEVD